MDKVAEFGKNTWTLAKAHWDRIAIVALWLGIIAMTFGMMMPVKEYTLELSQTPPDAMEAMAHEDSEQPKKKYRTKKKPAFIPVLNINTANAGQLDLLPGIGPKMAQRILQFRKTKGKIETLDQLQDVQGIGPKNFEKMRPYLRI